MNKTINYQHSNLKLVFVLIGFVSSTLILPPLLGRGVGGEVFSQLSPRYIKMPAKATFGNGGIDTVITFWDAVPTNRAGQMVGVAHGSCGKFGPPVTNFGVTTEYDAIPYIYRLDSLGKFISLKSIKFPATGISKYHFFNKIIPYKDSLYIIGEVDDKDPQYIPDCGQYNQFILKTDSAGNVVWKNKLGFYQGCELTRDHLVCSDGGILICGYAGLTNPFNLAKELGYSSYLTKYNADGSIKFNKAYRHPINTGDPIADTSRGIIDFVALAESPDKGYIVVGGGGNITYGIGAYPQGPHITKIDANGIKLWEKMPLFDTTVYRSKLIGAADIVPHPNGGYIIVGHAQINEWADSSIVGYYNYNEINGKKHYYGWNKSGGAIIKINETGDVEWTKIVRLDYNIDSKVVHREQEIPLTDITLSYTNGTPTGFIISGNAYGGVVSGANRHTLIIKTDLNGNLLWDREYYYPGSQANTYNETKVYEEPGGSLLVNSFADPEPIVNSIYTNNNGILRLNSNGILGSANCSNSPKLNIFDEGVPYKYDSSETIFVTTPALTGTLPSSSTNNKRTYTTTVSTCVNPITANFTHHVFCTNSGTIVYFSGGGTSWFNYDFGDPSSGVKNTNDSAYCEHLYTTPGTYTVTLTVWDGDSSSTATYKQAIEINPIKYITILPSNVTICQGTPFSLTATISSGVYATECPSCIFYAKEINDLSYITSSSDINVFNSNSNTFVSKLSFIMSTSNSCIHSDTAIINLLPIVTMSVTTNDSLLCAGDSTLLVAKGSTTYLWNSGNTTNDSLKVYPTTITNYLVWSGKNAVCGNDSASIKVTVYPPTIVDAGSEQIIYSGNEVQLTATGGSSYQWKPSTGLSSYSIFNPMANPTATTTYTVNVLDVNGCVGSDTVTIFVKTGCGSIAIPNAFSPNGDKINDGLVLTGECITDLEFLIFDRWGEQIVNYQLQNANGESSIKVWDGSFKGKAINSGIFVYYLKATFISNEIITKKGNISLIR